MRQIIWLWSRSGPGPGLKNPQGGQAGPVWIRAGGRPGRPPSRLDWKKYGRSWPDSGRSPFFWIGSRWLFESAGLGPAWKIMEIVRAMENHVFSSLVREGFGGAPKSFVFVNTHEKPFIGHSHKKWAAEFTQWLLRKQW